MQMNEIISLLEKRARGGIEEEIKENQVLDEASGSFVTKARSVNKRYILPDTGAIYKLLEIENEKTQDEQLNNLSNYELLREAELLCSKLKKYIEAKNDN